MTDTEVKPVTAPQPWNPDWDYIIGAPLQAWQRRLLEEFEKNPDTKLTIWQGRKL